MKKVFTVKSVLTAMLAVFIGNMLMAQPQGEFIAAIGTADDVKKIVLFDAGDGALVVDDFIDLTGYDVGTTKHVIKVNNELWVSSQTKDKVYRLDYEGNLLGVIGESGGLDNLRGMRIINGEVWLCNAGTSNNAPGNAIIQIDFDGEILGHFTVEGSPWSFWPYDGNNVLISFSNSGSFSSQIAEFDLSGTYLGAWNIPGELNFIQEITQMQNGNFLASSFSNATGGYVSGIHQYDGDGNYISTIGGTANGSTRGNWELGNGNIMWTNGQGVHIADINSGTSNLVYSGQFHYLEKISFGPAPVLNPPTNLAATVDENDVTLTWDAPEVKELTGYHVYRNDVLITASPVAETTYTDEDVVAGNHIYGVTAVYDNGESEKAGPVMIFIAGELGKIQGFVRDAVTNLSISEAAITASNTDNGALTYATPFGSHYVLFLSAGSYHITCTADGYSPYVLENVVVENDMVKSYNFYLQPTEGEILTGISNPSANSFEMYPNPASDYVVIAEEGVKYLQIIDQSGQVVYENRPGESQSRINLDKVPAGLYFVKIQTDSGISVEKLIVH